MKKTLNNQSPNTFPEKPCSVEVADILRAHIAEYQKTYPLLPEQYKIVHNLLSCRTSMLGGHIEKCDNCGAEQISYNSCRNRHCPKCQHMPRERWLEARKAELLPVPYFHNVFTLPHDLNSIVLFNKKVMLNILFKAVSETLLTFGENPKNRLGGKAGFIAILHTWNQTLNAHFHLHCLVPGGVMKEDGSWKPCKKNYLFSVKALSKTFRGKFIDYMSKAYKAGELEFPDTSSGLKNPDQFHRFKKTLYSKAWVVYVKPTVASPEYVLEYLGRYTHRVAISNHRVLSLKNGMVTFRYKDRKSGQKMTKTISAVDFIRRFLKHSLPNRFFRIRHFGFLSNRVKKRNIRRIRDSIGESEITSKTDKKSIDEMMLKLTGVDITCCPCCKKGRMRVVYEIPKKMYSPISEVIRPPNLRKSA